MLRPDFMTYLQSFVDKAEELNIVWKREAEDLFILQVFLKTNGSILVKNELYFSKRTVVTDLSKVLDLIIKASIQAAPGINLKIEGIPGMSNHTYAFNDLLKPSINNNGFTLIEEEEEEECTCNDFDSHEYCDCCCDNIRVGTRSEADRFKLVLQKIVNMIDESL